MPSSTSSSTAPSWAMPGSSGAVRGEGDGVIDGDTRVLHTRSSEEPVKHGRSLFGVVADAGPEVADAIRPGTGPRDRCGRPPGAARTAHLGRGRQIADI